MYRKSAVFVVCCLLYAVCVGQRVSKVIPIPDTLSDLRYPQHLSYNARLGKLYVLGYDQGGGAAVLDVATTSKVGQVKSCDDVAGVCMNWQDDRLFCARQLSRRLYVVNCSTDAVVDSVVTPDEPYSVQYCWRQGKVYANGFDSAVGVLDARSGNLIRTVPLPGFPLGLYYCDDLDRLYATVYSTESLSRVCAIDCGTDSLVAVTDVHAGICYTADYMVYDPPSRRLFCTNRTPWNDITVVDCEADTLIGYVPMGDYPLWLVREPTTGMIWCSNAWSKDVSVVDPATLAVVDTLPLCGGPTALYVNERDTLLYCACPDTGLVYAINPVSRAVVAVARVGADPCCMTVPDLGGRLYVANSSDNAVAIRDARTLEEVAFIPVGRFTPYDVCVDASRSLAFAFSVGGGDALVTTLDCAGDSVLRHTPVPGTFGSLGCVESLDKIYVGTQQPGYVDIVQASTGRLLKVLPGGEGTCWEPLYAWNAGKVYVLTNWGWLMAVDAHADTLLLRRELFGQTSSMCYDPAGNKLYIAEDADSRIQVLDCNTDSVVKVITWNIGTPSALCYEPNGNKVYVANGSGWSVSVIDCNRDTVLKTFRVGQTPTALALSPVNHKLYCANFGVYPNYDTTVSVIDTDGDSVIRTIGVGTEPGYTMCYNPTTDKMFVGTGHWGGSSLAVIRCSDDRVIKRMQVLGAFWESAVLPSANKLYVPSEGSRAISVVQDSVSVGLEELGATGAPRKVGATLVRGVLFLDENGDCPASNSMRCSEGLSPFSALLDISGRKVMELQPGANDVSGLASGVYFVRSGPSAASREPLAVSVRKVIISE